MALVVPNAAEKRALELLLKKVTPAEDLIIRLYSNNVTPGEADTEATYTEVSGGGYAAVTFTPASWTITEGGPTSAAYPKITWTFTGAVGNVYGYYVVESSSGKLRWAERFVDGPYNIDAAGKSIDVTPQFTGE